MFYLANFLKISIINIMPKNKTVKKNCKFEKTCIKDNMEINKKAIAKLEKILKTTEDLAFKKELKKSIKTLKSKKIMNDVKEKCRKTFCNVGCKNTLFENGNKISKFLSNKYKNDPDKMKMMTKLKETMFNKDETVLNDNFYKNLNPEYVKKLKAQGATSGCTNFSTDLLFLNY